MMKLNYTHYLALAVCILCAFVAFLYHFERAAYEPEEPTYNKEYWANEVRKKGSRVSYADFIQKNHTASPERQHLAAHVFGEVLYKAEGLSAITVCSPDFGFGCYHGFFGRAIAEEGIEAVSELDQLCVEAYGPLGTGCQHGIGHGILEYVGYDQLDEALDLCRNTTQKAPLLGCVSGVFMEYNVPLVGAGDGLAPSLRYFDGAHPEAPCSDIDEAYRNSCYFELGDWLMSVFKNDYLEAGSVCARFDVGYRSKCFLGVGNFLAYMTRYDVGESVSLCAKFASEDELFCRSGVSWAIFAAQGEHDASAEACQYQDPMSTKKCRRNADLTEGSDSNIAQ